MFKITNYLRTSVTAFFILLIGVSVVANTSATVSEMFNAPDQPVGFVVFDTVGDDPVGAGELFLACGPIDAEDDDISYRLFYSLTDASPDDPTTAQEYTSGSTAGDGDGENAFGFVIAGLDPGEEYSFWLYQYNNETNTFSEPAQDSAVAGDEANGDGDDSEPDPDPTDLEIVQDFEDESTFTIIDFEGLAGATIEPAPEGDNGNSLRLESVDDGNPWQGALVDQENIYLDLTNNLTVEIEVYATETFDLLLKLENGGPDTAAAQSYTEPNTWQTLTFTMNESLDGTDVADGIYESIVFFPNWDIDDAAFGAPSTFTVYIDNIASVPSEAGNDNDGGDNGEIGEESVIVDANSNWTGFANVFDLPEDGGEFIFASEWGVPDLRTDIDTEANTLTLFPNFNTYADNPDDPFWVDQTTQEGNKTFEGVSFIESTELAGNVLEFSGNVESFTLSAEYEVTAFIRVFNADFTFNKSVVADLTETGNFELVYDDVDLENDVTVQYGFTVVGPNANPDDLATLGNVVIGPPSLSNTQFDERELSVYPNPVNNVLKIQSATDFTSVELYNMNGRLMLKQVHADDINMQDFTSGVYLLKLTTNNGQSVTKKIIKE